MINPGRNVRDVTLCLLAATADCESVLELGCGVGNRLAVCRCAARVGVDAHLPYLEMAKRRWGGRIRRYIHSEALDYVTRTGLVYDAILMIDFLEHLEKTAALQLLERCRVVASRRIVLYGPEGECPQDVDVYDLGGERWQTHRSVWTLAELEALGFDIARWENYHGEGKHVLFGIRNQI
jgi:SAM-dependent methyltransferase